MELDQVIDLLSQVSLFHGLPVEELQFLATMLDEETHPPGRLLFSEGEWGDFLYIVAEGSVEVIKNLGAPGERRLALCGPAQCIGEISLFTRKGQRTASVRTQTFSRLLRMSRAHFESLFSREPALAFRVMSSLSETLVSTETSAIRDLMEKNRQLQEAYNQLKAAQVELVEKEKLERELQLARQIQMGVLPHPLPSCPAFEFAVFIEPARTVGGDFYDVIPLADGRMGLVIADVTDKGMPAAIFMAQTLAFLRAEASRGDPPVQVLRRVNRLLLSSNANGLFVTVLYGILDPEERSFHYARAGHELPIVRLPKVGLHQLSKTTGQPLGILDEPDLDENRLWLPPGSAMLLYTDGATDECDPQLVSFGLARLSATFVENAASSADQICQHIIETLAAYQDDAAQFDDIALMVVCSLST